MTCKTNKKINISVITALCANFPSTGPSCIRHTRMPWLGCFPAPGLGPPAQDISRGPMWWGLPLPLSLPFWLCTYIFNPAQPPAQALGKLPVPGGEWTSTLAVSWERGRRTEDPEKLPFRKRQPTTPQKKTLFPSVSLQRNGRGGPAVALLLSTRNRLLVHRIGELAADSRPLQADPAASILLAGPWFNKVKLKKHVENKTKHISSNVSFLVHNSCVSSYCFW